MNKILFLNGSNFGEAYTLWKNETYYDADFEKKKQQEPKALAAQDSIMI